MENKYVANLSNIHYTACFMYPATNSLYFQNYLSSTPSPIYYLTFDKLPLEFQSILSNFIQTNLPGMESISGEVNRVSYLEMNIDMNFDVAMVTKPHFGTPSFTQTSPKKFP